MKKIFKTENDVLTIAGSGTAGMEAAIATLVPRDKKVLVANGGKFGERWVKVSKVFGLDVDEIVLDWGTALQPELVKEKLDTGEYGAVITTYSETCTATATDVKAIGEIMKDTDAILLVDAITACGVLPLETDAWGLDVVASGSQKAFMLPPGLAMLAVSEKAWKCAENVDSPVFYLNLKAYRKSVADNDTPYTGPVSLIRGLEVAVNRINEVGIDTINARSALLAKATREAAEAIGLRVYSQQPSDSVTAICLPEGIGDEFRKELKTRYAASVAGGQADLKGKIFRISHMGYVDILDTIGLIAAIEYTLAAMGYDLEIGKGVARAVEILRDWE
jgi:aspartate aminotransferase-like enzyme